jgi:hypothetical protein
MSRFYSILVLVVGSANVSHATVVPFVEDFMSGSANWFNSSSSAPVGWASSGGPDNGSYATTTFNFVGSSSGSTPALFRAQDEFNSSAGALQGNWISDGVQKFQMRVRHNAGVPISFFVRFADPANFPGAAAAFSPPVPSGQWSFLQLSLPDPGLVYEGSFGYGDVFDNIGHVQVGVFTPNSLVGVNQVVTFDLDKVTILNNVPAASTWGLLALTISIAIAGTLMLRGGRASGFAAALLLAMMLPVQGARATTVPFTEEFSSGPANWTNNASAPLSWSASGGVADSAFAFGSFNFNATAANADVVTLRASQSAGASEGAFFGDWIADGVDEFQAFVRHDAPVPLTFFMRFASPFNFPGAVAINFVPVLPNQWTLVNVPIHPGNPQFVTFEGTDFTNVFDGIGNIQLGVRTPEALAGMNTSITFGIDSVSVVPEPAALALLGAGGLAVLGGRRRRAGRS